MKDEKLITYLFITKSAMEKTEQPYLVHTRDDVRSRRKMYYADEKDVAWMSGL